VENGDDVEAKDECGSDSQQWHGCYGEGADVEVKCDVDRGGVGAHPAVVRLLLEKGTTADVRTLSKSQL
jgi:hypothetical protein